MSTNHHSHNHPCCCDCCNYLNARLDYLESQIRGTGNLDRRLDRLERELRQLERRVDRIERRLDGITDADS